MPFVENRVANFKTGPFNIHLIYKQLFGDAVSLHAVKCFTCPFLHPIIQVVGAFLFLPDQLVALIQKPLVRNRPLGVLHWAGESILHMFRGTVYSCQLLVEKNKR
uniref:Uncharacterized protein n=1 Tax=Sphaerodactylus townsendi TaxID=933632 RepID=A0ACB8EVV2_9SAUR